MLEGAAERVTGEGGTGVNGSSVALDGSEQAAEGERRNYPEAKEKEQLVHWRE